MYPTPIQRIKRLTNSHSQAPQRGEEEYNLIAERPLRNKTCNTLETNSPQQSPQYHSQLGKTLVLQFTRAIHSSNVRAQMAHTHSKLHHCYSSLPRYTKQPLVTLGCTYLPSKWKPIRGAHPVHACPAKRVRCRVMKKNTF